MTLAIGTLTASGQATTIVPTLGDTACTLSINGTYSVFTGVIEGSDDGTNFYPLMAVRTDSPTIESSSVAPADNSSREWTISCVNLQKVRLRCTAITSGTVNVRFSSGFFSVSPLPVLALSAPLDGARVTYSAASVGIVPAGSATDIFEIRNTGTKLVRIHQLNVTGSAGAAALAHVILIKRSTLNTGGTAYTTPQTTNAQFPVAIPHDSTSPAATATMFAYSANPTTGTAVAQVRAQRIVVPTAATQNNLPQAMWDFGWRAGGQCPILRGPTESLCVNLNGVSLTSGVINVELQWSEE